MLGMLIAYGSEPHILVVKKKQLDENGNHVYVDFEPEELEQRAEE